MKARLFRAGADRGNPFEFGAEATVGRGDENSIRLDSDAISARHARIWFDEAVGRYRLEDLGSLNGTKLDGVALTRAEPLERLHVVEFGGDGREFVLQVVDLTPAEPVTSGEQAPAEATPTEDETPTTAVAPASGTAPDQEMPPLPEALAAEDDAEAAAPGAGTAPDQEMPPLPEKLAMDSEETLPVPPKSEPPSVPPDLGTTTRGPAPFYLRFHEPPDAEPRPLHPGSRVVGRARSADVSVESRAVSRRHAMLTVETERVTVQDLGSRNQTFVNDRPVDEPVELKAGDVIRFGELAATLQAGEDSA